MRGEETDWSGLRGTNSDCGSWEDHRVRQWRQKVKYLLGLGSCFSDGLTWQFLTLLYAPAAFSLTQG